jgi:hypothetical protein
MRFVKPEASWVKRRFVRGNSSMRTRISFAWNSCIETTQISNLNWNRLQSILLQVDSLTPLNFRSFWQDQMQIIKEFLQLLHFPWTHPIEFERANFFSCINLQDKTPEIPQITGTETSATSANLFTNQKSFAFYRPRASTFTAKEIFDFITEKGKNVKKESTRMRKVLIINFVGFPFVICTREVFKGFFTHLANNLNLLMVGPSTKI